MMTERSAPRDPDDPPDPDRRSRRVGRRSYLKLAGLTAGSVPLFGRNGAGATIGEKDDGGFARTVNAIEAGCDPTGRDACDRAFRRMLGDDTELRFPSGTYRFSEPHAVLGIDRFAIHGEGDVTFVVPSEFTANLLTIAGGSSLSVSGIDVDLTARGATPGLRLCARDSLLVEDIEFVGRGVPVERSGPVVNALSPVVRSPDGMGRIRDVTAHNDGLLESAPRRSNGRSGIQIGSATRGTITVSDCRFEGFPNGGAAVSETSGTVRIEGGRYRNNAVAGIRVGGVDSDSRVRNARVEVADDTAAAGVPETCGIRLQGGGAGATIEDCTIEIGPDLDGPAVVADYDYGGFSVRNSRLRAAGVIPAIRAHPPHGGRYSAPRGSLETRIEGCVLTSGQPNPLAFANRPAPHVAGSLLNGVPVEDDTLPVEL